MLAILEKADVISPFYSDQGLESIGVGTVSAGWQNFFICLEMLFASILLRFAFPHGVYSSAPTATHGRTVSLQSISSSLKETMNPRDVMQDAIHNFHPQYQQYMQQGSKIPPEEESGWPYDRPTPPRSLQGNQAVAQHAANGHLPPPRPPTIVPPRQRFNEKTTLLSSDDEFQ